MRLLSGCGCLAVNSQVAPRFLGFRFKHILPIMASGKLCSENFKSILTDDVLKVAKVISSVKRSDSGEKHEVRLVGGAVRDLLMDRKPKDVDLAATTLPEDTFRLCEESGFRTIATGLQHGTVTVVTEAGQNIEITSLRIDEETDGRHAVVKYTTDWQLDAARRDLTINAMSMDLEGRLYDYFNGEQDILDRRVQFVGNPMLRIQEDYLRILRYFRFHGRIANDPLVHEEITMSAIRELKDGLKQVATERISVEILSLITGRNGPEEIRMMYESGVAQVIGLPCPGQLDKLATVYDNQKRSGRPMSPITLLNALHDDSPIMGFAEKWKLSTVQRNLLFFIASNRGQQGDLKHYQDLLTDLKPASKPHVLELLVYQGHLDFAEAIDKWEIPAMPLNGQTLKERGLKTGPRMGIYLSKLRKEWQKSNFTLTADDLLKLV